MTSPMTGPAWYWIAGTTALVLWALAAITLTGVFPGRLCGLNWRHRDDREGHDDQATAVTRPPPRQAAAPAPGPRPPRHHTGGTTYTIRAWRCGCIHQWDGRGALTAVYACTRAAGPDWGRLEQELREP